MLIPVLEKSGYEVDIDFQKDISEMPDEELTPELDIGLSEKEPELDELALSENKPELDENTPELDDLALSENTPALNLDLDEQEIKAPSFSASNVALNDEPDVLSEKAEEEEDKEDEGEEYDDEEEEEEEDEGEEEKDDDEEEEDDDEEEEDDDEEEGEGEFVLKNDEELDLDLNDPKNYEFRMYLKNNKVGRHFKNILVKTFDSEDITSIEDIFDKNKKKIEREVTKKVERRVEKAHEKASNGHERVGFEKVLSSSATDTHTLSFRANEVKETRELLSMRRHPPHEGNSEVQWTSSISETRSRREGNPENNNYEVKNNNSNSNNIDNSRSQVFAQGSTEMTNLSSVITAKAVIQKRENSVDNTFNIENIKNGSTRLLPEYDNVYIADINILNKIVDPPPKEMCL